MISLANENLTQVGGANQTPADWTPFLGVLPSLDGSISAPVAVAVGSGAARLDTGLPGRQYILLVNNGLVPIYVGGAPTVTLANGVPLASGQSMTLELGAALALYGISTATQEVGVLEVASAFFSPPPPPFNPFRWEALWGGLCRHFTLRQFQLLGVLCATWEYTGTPCATGKQLEEALRLDGAELLAVASQLLAKGLVTLRFGQDGASTICLSRGGQQCCSK